MEKNKNLSVQLVAGGVAGAVSRTAVSPLERMKILFQVQGIGKAKYEGVLPTLAKVYREEGFRGYFKGNGTNCIRIIPYSAIQFAVYEQAKLVMVGANDELMTTSKRLIAGAMAGLASVAFTYPLDIARTRLSVINNNIYSSGSTGAVIALLPGSNIWNTIRWIYVNEGGIPALFRGLSPTSLGVAPYVAFNFAVYEGLKHWYKHQPQSKETLNSPTSKNINNNEASVITRLVFGGLAGTIAQTITYPLDLIRRRFQVMEMGGYGYKYTSTLNAFVTILRTEGIYGLYKGCVPNYLKVAPAMAISFVTYEQTKKLFLYLFFDCS